MKPFRGICHEDYQGDYCQTRKGDDLLSHTVYISECELPIKRILPVQSCSIRESSGPYRGGGYWDGINIFLNILQYTICGQNKIAPCKNYLLQ